jgi:peptide/nickel transport system substrate-binding protein
MSDIDRRQFLTGGLKAAAALGAAGVGGVLLDACGGSSASPPLKTLTHTQAVAVGVGAGKPRYGGTVAFGTEAEESGIDPTYAHFDSTGVMYARAVYDPLAIIDFAGRVQPYLAESIVPNKTYDEWTITVRKNVLFHDGTPCDGSALQFCMQEFLKSPLTNFVFTDYVALSTPAEISSSVKKIGPNTIRIFMEKPWVPFDYWLAGYIGGQNAYMFSPKQYLKGEAILNTHPVGTGPFVFQQWVPNSHFTLTRNPHYWRKDRYGNQLPYLDGFEFLPIPVVDTRYASLESGAINMMHTDYDPVIQEVVGNPKLNAIGDNELAVGEPDCNMAMINCADAVMKDPLIRQAFAYATDQSAINTYLGRSISKDTNGPFPSPSPYRSSTGYPDYDLAKAKSYYQAFLKKHGGVQPSITYTTTESSESLSDAEFIAQMWSKAGIKVSIGQVQQSKLIDDALAGGYQIFSWRQFSNINPDLNYVFWADTSGPINFARNSDPLIQTALDRARQSTSPSEQVAAYQEVAHRFAVDLPYIWFGRDVWYVAAEQKVQNWNNPTTPTGQRGLTMLAGIIWPTEIWLS